MGLQGLELDKWLHFLFVSKEEMELFIQVQDFAPMYVAYQIKGLGKLNKNFWEKK